MGFLNLISVVTFFICLSYLKRTEAVLKQDPKQYQPREIVSLNGLWKFKTSSKDDQEAGFREKWFKSSFKDYIDMPVPSSYNDVTTNRTIRDYIGWVWYQHSFKLPASMQDSKLLMLHFASVHYYCKVWVNGFFAGEHEGGHIPFELRWPTNAITNNCTSTFSPPFTITVAVNNTLTNWTIPQGKVIHTNYSTRYPPEYISYSHDFDYFDYAGINGHVTVYSYLELIHNVNIGTSFFSNGTGFISYFVSTKCDQCKCNVLLRDNDGNIIDNKEGCSNIILIPNAILWWPAYCGHTPVGYLYKLEVQLFRVGQNFYLADLYEMKVGIRTITWDGMSLYINNVPVYLRGFGMHQDAEIRGRGFDLVQTTRDMNLLQWIGANAIRTSHYPYPKEFIEFADRRGIMVILESPACSLSNFDDKMLAKHKKVMFEIHKEFNNHPSVIMWSLANEPLSNMIQADKYFGELVRYMKSLDSFRPITFVTSQTVINEKAAQHADIICINRYSGWYNDGGRLDLIQYQTVAELQCWYDKYHKPLIFTEYGAGAIPGLHTLPSTMWSENYQIELFQEHFQAFDAVRNFGFFVGEMVWNFADFYTPQEYIRPGACMKGVFTRNRQPKSSAYTLKQRFENLNQNNGIKYELPNVNILFNDNF